MRIIETIPGSSDCNAKEMPASSCPWDDCIERWDYASFIRKFMYLRANSSPNVTNLLGKKTHFFVSWPNENSFGFSFGSSCQKKTSVWLVHAAVEISFGNETKFCHREPFLFIELKFVVIKQFFYSCTAIHHLLPLLLFDLRQRSAATWVCVCSVQQRRGAVYQTYLCLQTLASNKW